MTFDEAKHPRGGKGSPEGGRFVPVGQARDANAAAAQKDPNAAKNYEALMRGGPAGLRKLSDGDLQKLTAYAYSSKTSDPDVVRARVRVANEMSRRGMDVKKYGAKGGGTPAPRKARRASGAMTTTELAAVQEADGSWRFDAHVTAPPEVRGGKLEPDEAATVTAAAIPVKPPAAWFADPELTEPTALTVTADGRVVGHAAAWGVRHIGLPGCRTAPKSASGYRFYRTGQVECDDGSMVATGRITMGAGHASLDGTLSAAAEHYDNVASAVADVAVGEDAHGIWYAGALRPEVTPEQVRTLRASSLSGDWRPAGRALEMVGLLAVNVPGFPTPRAALAASGGEVAALVAAGVVTREPIMAAPPPIPPAKDAAPPPAPEGMADVGDTVAIGESGLSGQVVEMDDDGAHVVVVCDPGDLVVAGPEDAVAASATVRDMLARLDRQDAELRGLRADRLLAGVPEQ